MGLNVFGVAVLMILFAAVADPLLIKNLSTMRTNQARNFTKTMGVQKLVVLSTEFLVDK